MNRTIEAIGRAVLVALLAAGMAAPVLAQGSSVNTQGACMSARNAAGVADPCDDGSAIFYNPAALALQPSAITAGVTAVWNERSFTYFDTGDEIESDGATAVVPHAYATYRVNERFAAGLGLFAPYGLTSEWPLEFEGRFTGYDNTLRGVYLQPTVAYQLIPGRLSVGAGLDVVFGGVEISRRIDLAGVRAAPGGPTFGQLGVPASTDIADLTLDGSTTSYTGQLSMLAQVTDKLSFGARVMGPANLDLDDGTANFEPVLRGGGVINVPGQGPVPLDTIAARLVRGPLSDQQVRTELDLPAQAAVGLAYDATRGVTLLADVWWTDWSTFDQLELGFERLPADTLFLVYQDAWAYRLGFDWDASPRWDVRGALVRTTEAQTDIAVSPLLAEAERWYYSAGIGYELRSGFRADAYFMWIDQEDRAGRVRPLLSPDADPEAVNVGTYEARAATYGITFSYSFGTERAW